jgi:FG-GAP-like repeat/PASTA domain/FG-GAP repeat
MRPAKTDPSHRASRRISAVRCGALLICIGTALVLGGAARTAAGPSLSFAAAKDYAIGNAPCSMAIGELNGDGKPDVVAGNCDATKVSVLLNQRNGAFEARRDYAAEHRPNRVEIADLSGDGKNDLLTANNLDRTISVLLNQGAGALGPPVTYALRLGRPRDSLLDVLIADLNGDDKPDLVTETGDAYPDTVSVMLNRGDGTFEPRRAYPQGQGVFDIALGDLNGDAKPELVIANPEIGNSGGLSVLVNAGDGSFETRRDYEMSGGPERLAIGDLNGDGKADVATADASTASVLLNRGDGSLGPGREYCRSCPISEVANAIAIADMNGDGKADLVAYWDEGNYSQTVSVLLNKGLGSFSARRSYEISYPESPSLAIVDVNGDGKPDIAAPYFAPGESGLSGLSVLLNKGAGWFEPGLYYRFGGDANAVASADLNGDGKPDIAAALSGRRHTVAVRLNAPGLCNVQWVGGMKVAAAKQRLGGANCRVGKVTRVFRKGVARGRVISQKPRFGAVLPGGAKVNLVVSRGKRRR